MKRINTKLQAEGAEFLVLGQLLMHGIPAYKAYSNMPGYDLVAVDPRAGTSARISVKSRFATDASGFIIKNVNCDFVVVVKLNRGTRRNGQDVRPPQFFVLPVRNVRKACRPGGWGRIPFGRIADFKACSERWESVRDFLSKAEPRSARKARR